MEPKRWNRAVEIIAAVTVVLAFAVPVWHFFFEKDYYLLVEAPCDPEAEACHVRDCSEEDSCPIGELEYFTSYRVHAADFEQCTDITCVPQCGNGLSCERVECTEDSGFECSAPEDFIEADTEEESEIEPESAVAE
jgi:hypothetical protein